MGRTAILIGVLSLWWFPAVEAGACSPWVHQNPGESRAHAYERMLRAHQDRYWAEADTIFIGEVVGLEYTAQGLEVSVRPRTSFKGDAGTSALSYDLDGDEVSCELAAFPDFQKVGIFYANRKNDRWIVRGMLGPNDVKDAGLKQRVIEQLTPGELTALAMETPIKDRRPLVFGSLAAACLFALGLALGRFWRRRA